MVARIDVSPVFSARNDTLKFLRSLRGLNKPALKRIADAVAEKARPKCAVDTGTLRDSIKSSVRKARGADEFIASVRTTAKIGDRMARKKTNFAKQKTYIKKNWNYGYGAAVELGVPSRGIAAQPFLRPAMMEALNDGTIAKIYQEETGKEAAVFNAGRRAA